MLPKNIALATSLFLTAACSAPKTITTPDHTVNTATNTVSNQVSEALQATPTTQEDPKSTPTTQEDPKSTSTAQEDPKSTSTANSANDHPFGRLVKLDPNLDTGAGRATQARLRPAPNSPKRFVKNPLGDCINAFQEAGFVIYSFQRFINPEHVTSLPGATTQEEVAQFRSGLTSLPNSGYAHVSKDQIQTPEDLERFSSIAEQWGCYFAFVNPNHTSDRFEINIFCAGDIHQF